MEEIWKPVACNKNYEVSNFGNIRNLKGHLLSQRDNGHGYKNVMLYGTPKRKVYYVHRLVAEAFIENPENKSEVNHLDGNKGNNIISNLEWCTRLENKMHALHSGLIKTTDKMRQNAKAQILKVNSNPELRKRALEAAAKTNKAKSKMEYMLNSSNQFKPLYCIELGRLFLNARRVEEKLGIKQNTVQCGIARGNDTCGGYHWRRITKHRFNNYGRSSSNT